MHRATARVDFAHVHPSWWVRALKDESPAVRRVVAASAPDPIRSRISDGLLLDPADLISERPVNPDVLEWTTALWSERLVAGEPQLPGDPPAVMVLSRLTLRLGYRVCHHAGLAKQALASPETPPRPPGRGGRSRWDWFGARVAAAGPEIRESSRRDLGSSALERVPARHYNAWLGALTLARLLAVAEPFRLRWALQHWPYGIAKFLRSHMPSASKRSAAELSGESIVLKAACDRLVVEKRLAWDLVRFPGPSDDGSAAP
jgi:hypothetical protein